MNFSERRAQLWVDAAVACINSSSCTKPESAAIFADAALAAFDKRFVGAAGVGTRPPVRVPDTKRIR